GRGGLGVHVPRDDRRARFARGGALGVPADEVGVVRRGRLELALAVEVEGGEGGVHADGRDDQPGRRGAWQVLAGGPFGGGRRGGGPALGRSGGRVGRGGRGHRAGGVRSVGVVGRVLAAAHQR